MFDTAVLVLLYNKEIKESTTINTLLESDIQYPNTKIVIWNNGPNKLKVNKCDTLTRLGYEQTVEETLNNESLAVIYNRFIAENSAQKYIFLDDDSILNSEYICASIKSKRDVVSMPVIRFGGTVLSPKVDDFPYSKEVKINESSKVMTIGSGLVIGSEIVDNFKRKYKDVFDERFYLYGVDSSFCLRLFNNNLTCMVRIIPGFEHFLSRLEKEGEKIIAFRKLERSYDTGLTLRYYYPLSHAIFKLLRIFLGFCKRKVLKQTTPILLLPLFKAFWTGKHYRS